MDELDLLEISKLYNPVITTGTFDGLHLGHRKVLSETIRIAKKYNGNPVVLTFWPHPRHVLGKGDFSLLNTLEERKELFKKMGIKHIYVQLFNKEFSSLSSADYVKEILVDKLRVKVLVVGYDHQFGKERSGKFDTLGLLATQFDFKLEQVQVLDMEGMNISSTKIRHALEIGNLSFANQMLGYDYFINGKVIDGHKKGRELGYPTANLELSDSLKMIPKDGIYAVNVCVKEKFYKGMLSIGFRPTFPDQPHIRTVEVNIFDFNEEIYNQNITVYLIERLRDEVKFSNIDELKNQMAMDKINSLKILKSSPQFSERLM